MPSKSWHNHMISICLYGIVKEFRPATPFLTPFLVSEKNVTLEEAYSQIYPIWTYSYMLALIPVFILTDLLRYKPIIILEAVGLVATWILLVFGDGLFQMQLMQITFGVSSAAEIAYFSYMYAIVDDKNYAKVASYIQSAALFGKLFAFGMGQVLITTGWSTYLFLNQVSLGATLVVFIISIFLPSVRPPVTSPNQDFTREPLTRGDAEKTKMDRGVRMYFNNIIYQLKEYGNNSTLLRWSLWWSLASCGIYQVGNYAQSLWAEMQFDSHHVENGLVEFTRSLLGVLVSFLIQFWKLDWLKHGHSVLFVSSLVISASLFVSAANQNIYVAYSMYLVAETTYRMIGTASSANIAREVSSSSHGLIFGFNTLVAVVLQSLLTFVVVDKSMLHMDIRSQFYVYAAYFLAVSLLFLLNLLISCVRGNSTSS